MHACVSECGSEDTAELCSLWWWCMYIMLSVLSDGFSVHSSVLITVDGMHSTHCALRMCDAQMMQTTQKCAIRARECVQQCCVESMYMENMCVSILQEQIRVYVQIALCGMWM